MAAAVDHLALHARLSPQRVFVEDLTYAKTWTFASCDAQVWRYCAELAERGVKPGDRVACLARNRCELPMLHFACARVGAIYTPLNWRLSKAELTALVEDSEPHLLIGDGRLSGAGLPGIEIDAFDAAASRHQGSSRAQTAKAGRPSLLLYTSGTSGEPKGALLSEANLLQTAINFSLLGQVTHESAFLCDAPMFHIIGLVTCVRPALMRGGRLLVSDGFDPARTLARLSDEALGATHYFCVPQMAAAMRASRTFDPAPLRRLVAIFTGGAPHAEAAIRAWLDDGVAIVDGYGMSEAGTVLGMPVDRSEIARRAGAVGVAPPGVETKIVDDAGNACEPGQPGELLLRGPNVMRAYWRRRKASEEAFAPGGWFRTGDIARRDQDGFHWIVDRKKDMFISGGENVYPAEIEAALAQDPTIRECAVIGVADAKWGEVGCLFVVLQGDAPADGEEIIARLAEIIARYKIPKRIEFMDALPRNGAGKVMKSRLREIAASKDATPRHGRT